MNVDEELDRLYRAPAAAFVAERNQLARALQRDGRVEEAEFVARLPRPSPVAWSVNQLHFHAPKDLESIFRSGAALRETQERLAGPDDFSRRKAEHQRALRGATDRALDLAREAGLNTGPNMRRGIETTLNLLGALGDAAPRVGRLSAELEPAGFETLSGALAATLPVKAANHDPTQSRGREPRDRELARLQEEVSRLEDAARASASQHEARAKEADEASHRADVARRARDDARRDSEILRARLVEARAELEKLRNGAEELE